MCSLLEKTRLSNFTEKEVREFIEKYPEAVFVCPRVCQDGGTIDNCSKANIGSYDGYKQDVLCCLKYIIPTSAIQHNDTTFLCKDRYEANDVYMEWQKDSRTIEARKKLIKKKLIFFKQCVIEYEDRLAELC